MKRFLNVALPILALSLMPFGAGADELAAASPAGFFKHFTVNRTATGGLDTISLNTQVNGLSLHLILDEIKKDIQAIQGSMAAGQSSPESLVLELDSLVDNEWPRAYRQHLTNAIKALQDLDAEATFNDNGFKRVMAKFEEQLKGNSPYYKVMAAPNNPTYYYQRAVLQQVVKQVIKYAQKTLGQVPVLSVVSFVVERAGIMIEQRRTFHQNMMLHYLENFTPDQLTLSEKEAALVKSSIYESRIPYNAIWMSNYARKHWNDYGRISFQNVTLGCDATLRRTSKIFYSESSRLNYAFAATTEKNQKKIVNLVDPQFMFSKKPATAYYYAKPKKVEQQRRLLRLGQLGLRFLTLPPGIVNAVESFLQSMYVNQIKTEGAMYGYFESNGNAEGTVRLKSQAINPLINGDL
jgi:hypothetical protein